MNTDKQSCMFLEDDIRCSIGLFGGSPTPGDCLGCKKRKNITIKNGRKMFHTVDIDEIRENSRNRQRGAKTDPKPDLVDNTKELSPSKGLGDTIAKATKAVGIKPCGKCQQRRKALNKMFPYKQKDQDPSGQDQQPNTADNSQKPD
tara:strand:+ start:13977 stop:14414 length:438 start_codon:yes stop_codon:yes gene_type:complete